MVKRCPNGTRRNKKTGKCEHKKRRLRSNSKRVRRCPNGFRRIPPKKGSCQKYKKGKSRFTPIRRGMGVDSGTSPGASPGTSPGASPGTPGTSPETKFIKEYERELIAEKIEKIKKSKKFLDLQKRIHELYALSRPGKPDPLLDAEKVKVGRELANMFNPDKILGRKSKY